MEKNVVSWEIRLDITYFTINIDQIFKKLFVRREQSENNKNNKNTSLSRTQIGI